MVRRRPPACSWGYSVVTTESVRTCATCGAKLSRYNPAELCAACERGASAPKPAGPPASIPPIREAWLYVGRSAVSPPDGSNVGDLLRAYRSAHNLTQGDLAALLGFDQSFVSMVERGKRAIRDVGELRRVASVLGIAPDDLGLLPVPDESPLPSEVATPSSAARVANESVGDDQRHWRMVRRTLNAHRNELSNAAKLLYPQHSGVLGVLSRPEWIADSPIPLDRIQLSWHGRLDTPRIIGAEPQSSDVRPFASVGTRFERYSRAIKAIERPTLFENRVSFRLADVEWTSNGAYLGFGYTTYFDMVDVCEAAAHELTAAWLEGGSSGEWLGSPTWSRLPFRSLIGDPFDLTRRALLPSIDTLTIRLGRDGASFILHRRESANVALAGGYYHVMPCGVFQPSTLSPWDQSNDFDLWRNMMREYSEEFLGMPEADGSSGEPIEYARVEPFRSLNDAKVDGTLRAYSFGIGIDPLTLAGEILAVVVIEESVYDRIFDGLVSTNSEGSIVAASPSLSAGIPFNERNIRRLLDEEPLAPAAAACLDLAWQHRHMLID